MSSRFLISLVINIHQRPGSQSEITVFPITKHDRSGRMSFNFHVQRLFFVYGGGSFKGFRNEGHAQSVGRKGLGCFNVIGFICNARLKAGFGT